MYVYVYTHTYHVYFYHEVNVGSCSILRTNWRQTRRSAKFDGTLVENFRWHFYLIQMGCAVVTKHCVIPWIGCREIWTTYESVFKQNQSFPVRRGKSEKHDFLMWSFCRLGGKHVSRDEDRRDHTECSERVFSLLQVEMDWRTGGNIGNQLEKASG